MMVSKHCKSVEVDHTDWYDLVMSRNPYLCRILAVGLAIGLQLSPALPVSADDAVELRPSITHPSESVAPGRTAPSIIQPSQSGASPRPAPSVSSSAAQSVQSDFDQHLQILRNTRRAQPSAAPTGAANIDLNSSGATRFASPETPTQANAPDDQISISAPRLESLISVNEFLNPFSLDASSSTPITLKQALDTGLERNLDLAISLTQTKQGKFAYYSALGKFLPDLTAGFSEYFSKGHIGLPFNIFAAAGGAAAGVAGNNAALTQTSSTIRSSGRDTTVTVNRPFIVMHAGGEFFAYRGGSVLFGALQARNNYRARTQGERATLSDTLLTIARNYYDLVLAEVVLQIRIDAVRTSEEQLRLNQARFKSGLATNLEVLQSKTQLSRDKQALADQQINRRSAAITLATNLNFDLGADLKPANTLVQKVRLVDPTLSVNQVLAMAIEHRPELKQYEQLRRAAKKALIVTTANLQPTVSLSGQAYGIGPPSNVEALGVFSVNANWRLRGIATVDSMEVMRAKWEARQAALQSQKELQTVCSEVRNSYLQILDKERNVAEATNEVISSAEELRLAELRKSSGLGINLDIITAQRDYTQARVSKAQAIIDYNKAQVQLLHDTGLISIAGLTSGRILSKSDL